MITDKVNTANDVKNLEFGELNCLANEVRELIIKKVNTTGGHMGPNLGFIEATIALHYVFNSPVDKFVAPSSIFVCNPSALLFIYSFILTISKTLLTSSSLTLLFPIVILL